MNNLLDVCIRALNINTRLTDEHTSADTIRLRCAFQETLGSFLQEWILYVQIFATIQFTCRCGETRLPAPANVNHEIVTLLVIFLVSPYLNPISSVPKARYLHCSPCNHLLQPMRLMLYRFIFCSMCNQSS